MTDEDLPSIDLLPEPQAAPRKGPGRVLALWLGIVGLLAAGVFGALFLAGEDEGSPEDAVQRMFDAISDEDVLGVLAALPPSERDPLRDNLSAMATELKRLQILSGDFDLHKVRGVDLNFRDLQFTSKPVGEGVSAVSITSGKLDYRVTPRDLPLGSFVTDLFGDELPTEPATGSEDSPSTTGDDEAIVTIKEDGRWYVSLNYSLAESARHAAGAPVPKFGKGLQADGESSPEKAVDALLRAALGLDVERAITLMPPDEGRVLRDYAPLFIDDAKQGAADVDFKADVKRLELSADRSGGHASVALERFEIAFAAGDVNGTVGYDGKCVSFSGPDVPPGEGRFCPGDAAAADLPPSVSDLASRLPTQGFVAVEKNGEWYVSPTRTLLESVVGLLKAVDRSDLEELMGFVGSTSEA